MRLALDGADFSYKAGQAALLGMSGQPEHVPYSIASSPEESREQGYLEFLLKLEPDGRWGPHLAGIRAGARVRVKGPRGAFVFPDSPKERHFLFVAGGTGIAPLRSMIRHAFALRYSGQLRLLYSARTRDDFAYRAELNRYARAGRLQLVLTATRQAGGGWRGEHGRITRERLARLLEAPETLCFVCGPTKMVEDVPRMLNDLGIPNEKIRIENW